MSKKIFSEEHKRKLRKLLKSYNTKERALKISQGKLGKSNFKIKGKNHYKWRGSKVGYRALHSWIVRYFGKANHCEECGLDRIPEGMKRYFQWANLSGKYKRDIKDWKQLCVKCHKLFDKKICVQNI
mgnify:CR=1 FL=1